MPRGNSPPLTRLASVPFPHPFASPGYVFARAVRREHPQEDETILDYQDDEEQTAEAPTETKTEVKGSYAGTNASGFRDFLLKPQLLRSIVDCGFEHPSEGAPEGLDTGSATGCAPSS